MNKLTSSLLLALVTSFTSSASFASESAHGDHEFKHHVVGVFLGATHIDGENEQTYGFEYEYRFDDFWGAGVTYERIEDAHHGEGVSLKLLNAYIHPYGDLRLGLGFGQEEVSDGHTEDEDVYRFSAAYDFHVAGFGVAPTLSFDRVDSETNEVFGIVFSKSF